MKRCLPYRMLPMLGWFLVLFVFHPAPARAGGAAPAGADWNVAMLDQLLAAVSPNQTTVQIGDMLVPVPYLLAWRDHLAGGPPPKIAFSGGFTPWTGGNVYYAFDASVSAPDQKAFLDAAAEWAMFANLHFIARTAEANYILVTNNADLGGGLSAVGMVGGAQLLQIGPGAWNRGTLCHELGHALGLVHEQQRADRDSFVTILTNNILAGHLPDFVKLTDSQNKSPYDFLSVMHYARNAFSVDAASNTIQTLPAFDQYLDLMGNSDPVLSASDRAGMAQMYGAGPGGTNYVTNTLDGGPGSLRAALYYAFDHPGTAVSFNIPVTDPGYSNHVFNILPSDKFPNLVNGTMLDGGTEPANSNPAGPEILLDGGLCHTPSVYASGLQCKGTNCVIRSLVINDFPVCGVLIDGSNAVGNTVSGCYLGIDPTGTVAVPNGICPIQIANGASGNTIGGTTVAARNVIGGSVYQGVVIRDAGTRNNAIQGNYLGVNATGTAALPNAWSGIEIFGGASSNLVGGFTASARNVISGNAFQGVLISDATSTGNRVVGNYIGVNPSGTVALPNGWSGVEIYGDAGGTVIGSEGAGAGNLISGNLNYGILIRSTNDLGQTIQGNFIGLNAAGNSAIPNAFAGVGLYAGTRSTLVGGFQPADRNVISGNADQGVSIHDPGSSGNVVAGNYIGVNPAGTTALGNGWAGVDFANGAASNAIALNLISGNGNAGIVLGGPGTANNTVWGNRIGVDTTGSMAISNAWAGIFLYSGAQSNVIGGVVASDRNVISGNGNQGILLNQTNISQNVIQGNYIGLNASGTAALSNGWSGIEISFGPPTNVIGGLGGARNFISGNGNYGISISYASDENLIQGNTIGLDGANRAAIPNGYAGLALYAGARANQVGGMSPGAANLISGSQSDGVQLFDAATTNNPIRGNSIYHNAYNAIALYNSANQNLAAPALAAAVVTTNTLVTGSFAGASGSACQLDFYADAPPAVAAQAQTYLGSATVMGTGGSAGFAVTLGACLPPGRVVTATLTDPACNTSQLSTGIATTMVSSVDDGIPDAWRARYFGGSGTTTNSLSASFADPDLDGLSNGQEFLAGTNPTNAASVLRLTAFNANVSAPLVSLNSVRGIIYRVQSCDDLLSGVWSILADQIVGTGANIFLNDAGAPATPRRFYRAQVLW